MIFIFFRLFELVLSLLVVNYSLNLFNMVLPTWVLIILFIHAAFTISKIKIHFTFIDAIQIPVVLLLSMYILEFDPGYWLSDYGNIPLYIGIIGAVAVLPRIHASYNQLKKV